MSDVGIGMQWRKASVFLCSNGHLEWCMCMTHDGPSMMNSILYHTIKPKQVMNKPFYLSGPDRHTTWPPPNMFFFERCKLENQHYLP